MNGLGNFFQWLACLILYSPIEPEPVDTELETVNEKQLYVPVLDTCGGTNTLTANFNNGEGRIRGRAFGCSNSFQNKSGVIGGSYSFQFGIDPEDLIADVEYEFRAQVSTAGRMRHFPAEEPSGFFQRQPPANTIGLVFTYIRVYEVESGGNLDRIALSDQQLHYSRTLLATAGISLNEAFLTNENVSVRFTPSGDSPIFIDAEVSIQAVARGSFSNIRIGSLSNVNQGSATVALTGAVVQKVLEDDACAGLFGE